MRRILSIVTLGMVLGALWGGAGTAAAETGTKALILGSSVSGGASSLEAQDAAAHGFTVTVVDDSTWNAMTAADFAGYQLVVIGDPTCDDITPAASANAGALTDAVMARAGGNALIGNRVLVGTDPVYHQNTGQAKTLIDDGIEFAGLRDGATGLYVDMSCHDADRDGNGVGDVQDTVLSRLTIATANWTQNEEPPCGGAVSLISNADQFADLTTAGLAGWGCSVHETFPTFPADWLPLSIATDAATRPTCGKDVDTAKTQCGEAYVLVSGTGLRAEAPNLALDPVTSSGPVGTTHTVTATLADDAGAPLPGLKVTWVVTGANGGAAGTCAPADCTSGADGKVTFTYAGTATGDDTVNASITLDGSTQAATAARTWTAAPPPVETPVSAPPVTTPGGQVLGTVQASCASKRYFRITVRKHGLRRAIVRVNGKRVATRRRNGRFVAQVDLRSLPSGEYVVTIVARTRDGKVLRGKRAYHTCAAKRPHTTPPL